MTDRADEAAVLRSLGQRTPGRMAERLLRPRVGHGVTDGRGVGHRVSHGRGGAAVNPLDRIAIQRHDRPMRQYRARVEFRRRDLNAGWVLAGVFIDHRFWPARFGVERLRGRLAGPGLAGWTDLPEPIVAPDIETAAEVALDVARQRWPRRDRDTIPFGTGRAS